MTTMIKVHPSLKVYFGHCLYRSALHLRALFQSELERFGLCFPQFGILNLLKHLGPTSQVDIGTYMQVDKATMVKMVDGLEKMKYLKRGGKGADRRVNLLTLTSKGRGQHKKIMKVAEKVEQSFLSPLNPSEQKAIKRLVLKLIE